MCNIRCNTTYSAITGHYTKSYLWADCANTLAKITFDRHAHGYKRWTRNSQPDLRSNLSKIYVLICKIWCYLNLYAITSKLTLFSQSIIASYIRIKVCLFANSRFDWHTKREHTRLYTLYVHTLRTCSKINFILKYFTF